MSSGKTRVQHSVIYVYCYFAKGATRFHCQPKAFMHRSDPTLREVIASLEHLEQLLRPEQKQQQECQLPDAQGEPASEVDDAKLWSRTAAVHKWAADLRARIE